MIGLKRKVEIEMAIVGVSPSRHAVMSCRSHLTMLALCMLLAGVVPNTAKRHHEQKQRGSAGRPRDEVALTDLRRAHGDAMRRDGPSQAWRARRTDQGD